MAVSARRCPRPEQPQRCSGGLLCERYTITVRAGPATAGQGLLNPFISLPPNWQKQVFKVKHSLKSLPYGSPNTCPAAAPLCPGTDRGGGQGRAGGAGKGRAMSRRRFPGRRRGRDSTALPGRAPSGPRPQTGNPQRPGPGRCQARPPPLVCPSVCPSRPRPVPPAARGPLGSARPGPARGGRSATRPAGARQRHRG